MRVGPPVQFCLLDPCGTHQWRHLGEQLARTLHCILEIAETVNVSYNATGSS